MVEGREEVLARVRDQGLAAASPTDLLAIGIARRPQDLEIAERQARELLRRCGSIRAVLELSASSMKADFGLDEFDALRAMALIELGRRTGQATKPEPNRIDAPEDAFALVQDLRLEKREHFVALFLDAKNGVIRRATIHVGTLTMSLVGVREVFREGVREGASQLIVAHNHPSGDPTPSPEDIDVTQKLADAGKLLDIPLVDHIIVGERSWVSLRQRGLISDA